MKKSLLIFSFIFLSFGVIAQVGTSVDLGGSIGSSGGSISASGMKNWGLGSKKKFYIENSVKV